VGDGEAGERAVTPPESPSSLLEGAAQRLESMATAATQGVWKSTPLPNAVGEANVMVGDSSLFNSSCCGGHCWGHVDRAEDADWIATMSPAVAQPLTNILRGVAFTLKCHPEYAHTERNYLELARLILGESP
jgi:hypothetical protein